MNDQQTALDNLRATIARNDVAAAIVTRVVNVGYLTGFDGVFDDEDAHAALVTPTDAVVFTDSRYVDALTAAAAGSAWRIHMPAQGDVLSAACVEAGSESEGVRIGLESTMPFWRFDATRTASVAEVVPMTGWVEDLRLVKSDEEIERISAAQALTDRAFEYLLGTLREGLTEREVALELEFFMRREGSEGVAFAPIVASGPNSALPHATPTDRRLTAGDFVVLDFGAKVGGYCADMTRTVVIGSASAEQRAIYDAVLAANEAGIRKIAAGVLGKEADAAARAVIAERGFGERFGHGLGHGVGREVHEAPSVGPRGEKALPASSVVTVEPGIYIPGSGGVRIEDLVVVEEAGARVLTRSTKDLIEV